MYVLCKTENCKKTILLEECQKNIKKTNLPLFKKNYYLCNSCGKVYPYTKEEHFFD